MPSFWSRRARLPEPFGVFYERHFASVLAFFGAGCAARRKRSISPPRRSPPRLPRCLAFSRDQSRRRRGCSRLRATSCTKPCAAAAFRTRRGARSRCSRSSSMTRRSRSSRRPRALRRSSYSRRWPRAARGDRGHHLEERGYTEIAAELRVLGERRPQAREPRPGCAACPTSAGEATCLIRSPI